MARKAKLQGYDYGLGQKVERTVKEWQAMMKTHVDSGGRRRVEDGETYIHAKGGRIAAEIYGNLPKGTGDEEPITCI